MTTERGVESVTLFLIASLNRILQKLKRRDTRLAPLDLAMFEFSLLAKRLNFLSDTIATGTLNVTL